MTMHALGEIVATRTMTFEGIPLVYLDTVEGHTIYAGIAWLDSDLAARLLKYNTANRRQRKSGIDTLERQLDLDLWAMTGEALKFSDDNVMLDGQHRAETISRDKSGRLYPVVIMWGLDRDAQTSMDSGAKRSADDQLKLAGIPASKTEAAVIRMIVMWEQGIVQSTDVSNAEIVRWGLMNPDKVARLVNLRPFAKLPGIPPAYMTYAAYRLTLRDYDAALKFLALLNDPSMLPTDSPILALRKCFNSATEENRGRRLSPNDALAHVFQAWNYWRNGRSITLLKAPIGGWNANNTPPVI